MSLSAAPHPLGTALPGQRCARCSGPRVPPSPAGICRPEAVLRARLPPSAPGLSTAHVFCLRASSLGPESSSPASITGSVPPRAKAAGRLLHPGAGAPSAAASLPASPGACPGWDGAPLPPSVTASSASARAAQRQRCGAVRCGGARPPPHLPAALAGLLPDRKRSNFLSRPTLPAPSSCLRCRQPSSAQRSPAPSPPPPPLYPLPEHPLLFGFAGSGEGDSAPSPVASPGSGRYAGGLSCSCPRRATRLGWLEPPRHPSEETARGVRGEAWLWGAVEVGAPWVSWQGEGSESSGCGWARAGDARRGLPGHPVPVQGGCTQISLGASWHGAAVMAWGMSHATHHYPLSPLGDALSPKPSHHGLRDWWCPPPTAAALQRDGPGWPMALLCQGLSRGHGAGTGAAGGFHRTWPMHVMELLPRPQHLAAQQGWEL